MRLLYESARIPVIASIPRDAGTRLDGATVEGLAWLTVRSFEEGEVLPKEHDHARPLRRWIEQLAGRPPGSTLPAAFRTTSGAREVLVPPEVIAGLVPDTIIAVDWEFEPR